MRSWIEAISPEIRTARLMPWKRQSHEAKRNRRPSFSIAQACFHWLISPDLIRRIRPPHFPPVPEFGQRDCVLLPVH
jgi:hypothetical protein